MDDRPPRISTAPQVGARATSAWVVWIAFAAVMLAFLGTVHVAEGVAALVNGSPARVTGADRLVHVSLTTWGWGNIVVGVVLFLASVGVFGGRPWARAVGTLVALLSALLHFILLAAQPLWSTTMIVVCIVVVMALTVHGGEIRGDTG